MMDSTIKNIATVFSIDADALKADLKHQPRRRSIIHEFSVNATVHGIQGIGRSKSITNRIFWTVSFLGFMGIMIYFVVQSLQSYFGYPTQTLVSFVAQRVQPFPAVSICNFSPVRFDTFIGLFINYTNSMNLTDTNDTSTITLYQSQFIQDFFRQVLNRNGTAYKFLFPLESMLMFCAYNGARCYPSDFISFLSAAYGACYTFNAKMKFNTNSVRNATQNGGTGLLQLQLYAHSNQYVPYIANDASAGMVILVHDNTELPMIENVGIQLAPGRRHKLGYKKRTNELLPAPYSDCTTTVPLVMQTMFDQYNGADYVYSTVLCSMLCVANYVYAKCGCANPNQWNARGVLDPVTNQIVVAPLCNARDPCYNNATIEILNTDSLWNQYCFNCSESCLRVDFIVTPSSVAAPSNTALPFIKTFVEQSNITLTQNWSSTWKSDIQNNYVSVDIICEVSLVETYTQSALLSGVDLLSNIGGLTGLWIGASFLSLMELVEMFYRLVRYHYFVFRQRAVQNEIIDIKL